jgi:Alcohol dehydrogenase GroES-associated
MCPSRCPCAFQLNPLPRRDSRSPLTMKALTWHGKQDVRIDTVPDPGIQEPGDIIVSRHCNGDQLSSRAQAAARVRTPSQLAT